MKAFWVLFAVVAGASADLMCLNNHLVPRCIISNTGEDFCTTMPDLKRCVEELAEDCEVASRAEVISVLTAFNDICQEGTNINEEFKKHEACMKNLDQEDILTCSLPFMKEVMRITRPTSLEDTAAQDMFKRRIFEISCRHNDELYQCVIEAVKKNCGSEAGDFYHALNSISNGLNQQACQENNSYLDNIPSAVLIE